MAFLFLLYEIYTNSEYRIIIKKSRAFHNALDTRF